MLHSLAGQRHVELALPFCRGVRQPECGRSPGSNLLERLCPLLIGEDASGESPDVGPFRDRENVFDYGTTDELWDRE